MDSVLSREPTQQVEDRQSNHGSEQLGKGAVVQFAKGDETQREAGTREEATVMEADGI